MGVSHADASVAETNGCHPKRDGIIRRDDVMALQAGIRVGPYKIIALLGAGGMGEVYRARDTKLDRDIALKILPDVFAADPERLARFEREAKTLASLNHPHIAHIYGVEDTGGSRALVMEFVDGEDLAQRIARRPIPLEDVLSIARQTAEALEAAHDQGIIHRDLKPANLKVRDDGTVKVLDFGLAKALEPVAGAAPPPSPGAREATPMNSPTITSPAMTQIGVILGTAAYMSPEQAKGKPADKRSDIWAFGCVLYEMLTGRRAFDGDDVSETLASVLARQPQFAALSPDLDVRLTELLKRCLEKDPKQRWQAIGDVRVELEHVRLTKPPHALTGGAAGLRWWHVAAAIALAATFATAITMAVLGHRGGATTTAQVVRFSFRPPDEQVFTRFDRNVVDISPDGSQLAFVTNDGLYVRRIDGEESRLVQRGTAIVEPLFSRDGTSIVYNSNDALFRTAITGGTPVRLTTGARPLGLSWDGDDLVFSREAQGIVRLRAGAGAAEILIPVAAPQVAYGAQVLPGGTHVLYALAPGPFDWEQAKIVVQRIGETSPTVLVEGFTDARYRAEGFLLLFSSGAIHGVAFDARTHRILGAPVALVDGVRRTSNAGSATGGGHYAVSANGTLFYYPGPVGGIDTREIFLVSRNGDARRLSLPPGRYVHPRLSPDGRRLAVQNFDGRDTAIWIAELSGNTAPRRLTFGGEDRFPVWVGDHRVAFQSNRDGDLAIYLQAQDGSDAGIRLTRPASGAAHMPEAWSDTAGNRIFYSETREGTATLWSVAVNERPSSTRFGSVTSTRPLNADISPDGQWVTYTVRGSSFTSVFVEPMTATGAKYQIAAASGHHSMWSRDGTELFYSEGARAVHAVRVVSRGGLTFSPPAALSFVQPTNADTPRQMDVSPDGKTFVAIAVRGTVRGEGDIASEPRVVVNWLDEVRRRLDIQP
jgi:eukaryotic-like serine/threonine-protein kinase